MRLFDMDSKEDYLLDGKYKVATPYAPCVNVAEIVRCKDCRWWNCKNLNYQHNNHLCRYWSKFGSIDTSADDFCSYGERREE